MNDMTNDDWQLIRQLLNMLRRSDQTPSEPVGFQPGGQLSVMSHTSGCGAPSGSPGSAGSQAESLSDLPVRPEPGVIRLLIRERERRRAMFGAQLVADPVWDMLLDLTAACLEGRQVSVTSLCLASGVPQSTALRWIGRMERAGMVERIDDRLDRRRAFVRLSRKTLRDMLRFLAPDQHDRAGAKPIPAAGQPSFRSGQLRQLYG